MLVTACSACGAVGEDPEHADTPTQSSEVPATTAEMVVPSSPWPEGMVPESTEQPELEEDVGEAGSELSWQGPACRAACWAIASAGCGAVGALCAGGSAITVGGVAVPCVVAVAAACGAAGGGASLCSDWCTQRYGQ